MFMIKSLFGKVWGDPQNPELVQLKAGMLFLVRPNSIKGSRECIFKDAVATVRRTTAEFQYQLVITRAYEEGEAELLDGDAETEDERSFLVDTSLHFRSSSFEGEPSFAWKDIDYDEDDETEDLEGELLEFVVDSKQVDRSTLNVFELTMLRCMFERKYNTSHTEATDAELDALKFKPQHASNSLSTIQSPATASPTRSKSLSLEDTFNSMSLSQTSPTSPLHNSSRSVAPDTPTPQTRAPTSVATTSAPPAASLDLGAPVTVDNQEEEPLQRIRAVVDDGEPVTDNLPVHFAGSAEIYVFDLEAESFALQGVVDVKVVEKKRNKFNYWFVCQLADEDEDEPVITEQPIEVDTNYRWSQEYMAFIWNYIPLAGDPSQATTWSLRFSAPAEYLDFNHMFNRCLWEKTNQISWGKVKAEDQAYIYSALGDVEMKDIDEGDEDDEEEMQRRAQEEEEEEEDDIDEDIAPAHEYSDSDSDEDSVGGRPSAAAKDGSQNEQLAVGYRHDRSFVVRGNNIGVFRHTDDDQLKFSTTIRKVMTPGGKAFAPKKVMLHNEDSSMLLMNKDDPHSVYRMDLEYGKVVDEWKVSDHVNVDNILPDSKFAQMTAQQTLIGHSHNGLFRIDPRLGGNKIVEDQFKQYAGKNAFSAATTTESGKIAVASDKGDIRLFDSIGKIAKTALPSYGDAILGVDVTADGRWLIATCKTYLLLVDTLIGEGKNKGQLGFDKSFPAASKPVPRRLQLKPEHVAYMEHNVSFTPARFNTNQNEEEKSIITSSGPFVVTWNFRKVKQGRLDEYQIKRYDDKVVADNFRHGADKNIVVALPNDVFMVNKRHLAKPSRQSLSTPTKLLKSRSSIVEQPY